ncbi:MAG: hypothetical protein AB1756_01000 [Acidobacteriota bacterium]
MKNDKTRSFMSLFVLIILLLFSPCLVALAQEEGKGEVIAKPSEEEKEKEKAIEKIIQEKEEVITGKYFSYNPEGRRDPFRSLIEEVRAKEKGPRPKGIAGMLISEIDLVGIVKDPAGNIAFFSGSDNRGYFLRVGDEVYDGKLISIDDDAGIVTFRQQVDDPRLIKPFRDVVKRLSPVEEESK